MEFRIEGGVEVPGRVAYPLGEMEVGDSFVVSGELEESIRSASWQYGRRHGRRYAVRRDARGLLRCWRVE